ncbi:MAG: PAS domain S-box protein, partial [Chlorobiales bacterium]|nr:PAS domain S-box protein [Chlorobiales bacterium]
LAIKQVSVAGDQLYLVRLHDVTDRKTAEDAVRQSEEKYRTLVANIPGAVYRCRCDEQWTMEFISDSIQAISGYAKDEFINNASRSFASIVHPEDTEPIRRFIDASLAARQPYELEYRIIHKEGTFRWVYEKGQAVFDQQGNVQWLEGVIIDATELKRAEEAKIAVQIVEEHANEMKIINEALEKEVWDHRQTEVALYKRNAMLRAMADAARMLLTTGELGTAITQVLNLLGNATEVDRVYIVENHQHPETGDMLMSTRFEWTRQGREVYSQASSFQNLPYLSGFSRWYDLLSQGKGVSGLTDDFPNSERWILEDRAVVSILVAPIMIGNAFWGFMGFDDCYSQHNWGGAEDVILTVAAGTIGEAIARRKMVQALSESEKKYRSVLDSITEVVFQTDTNRIVTFLNPAWAKITGYELYESLGKDILEHIYPDDRDSFLDDFSRIVSGKKDACRIELRFVAKDGHIGWIEMFVQGIWSEDGRPIGLSGTLADISNRKEAEQQAKNLTQQLLQAQKMEAIGTLAGGIAHDFNNIMGIITMAVAHMRIKAKMDEVLLKDAEIVDEAAERGAGIARQLLTFSRSQKTQVMPISVSHVVKQLKRMLSHSLPKDIEIQTEFRDNNNMINGDHGQIYQVLLNLAVNSGDAMPNGGILRFDVFTEQGAVLEKKFGKKMPENIAIRELEQSVFSASSSQSRPKSGKNCPGDPPDGSPENAGLKSRRYP